MAARLTGTVKWFNDTKGFGFISPEGGGKDLFIHYSDIEDTGGRKTLVEGERVEFTAEEADKGPAAKQVKKI